MGGYKNLGRYYVKEQCTINAQYWQTSCSVTLSWGSLYTYGCFAYKSRCGDYSRWYGLVFGFCGYSDIIANRPSKQSKNLSTSDFMSSVSHSLPYYTVWNFFISEMDTVETPTKDAVRSKRYRNEKKRKVGPDEAYKELEKNRKRAYRKAVKKEKAKYKQLCMLSSLQELGHRTCRQAHSLHFFKMLSNLSGIH